MVSESSLLTKIRLAASKLGAVLYRNNVGAGRLENGSFVRWGLCNDSETVNAHTKSGDCIGIRTVIITPEMVGKKIGQFVSVEIKKPGWRYTGTPREEAQENWRRIVSDRGGLALFASSVEEVVAALTRHELD